MRKYSGIKLIAYLIAAFFIFSTAIFFCVRLGVAIVFGLKTDGFFFSWERGVLDSLKRGAIVSIPLGIGIWFMSWMKERKEKRPPSDPD
jgi:hypothetical protein